jgi:hypothetical protein
LPDEIVYDAQTTSGGSGGPLFNDEGKVIGINFAMVREFSGSNFAIPVGYGTSLLNLKPPPRNREAQALSEPITYFISNSSELRNISGVRPVPLRHGCNGDARETRRVLDNGL